MVGSASPTLITHMTTHWASISMTGKKVIYDVLFSEIRSEILVLYSTKMCILIQN